MRTLLIVLGLFLLSDALTKRALQKSHEKSREEKWRMKLLPKEKFDQAGSLIDLLTMIATKYLADCVPTILYDKFTEGDGDLLLEKLFRGMKVAYVHGQITEDNQIKTAQVITGTGSCSSYIIFMKDVMRCKDVIGPQNTNKVVIISRSSQWRTYEFLTSDVAKDFVNLLVISRSESIQSESKEQPYILYTHNLYTDALGSSTSQVLTSWMNGGLTRPQVSLFPRKISKGFAGHRFIISLGHQPPYVIKRGITDNNDIQWDGIEIRLVDLLSKMYNFTTDYREAPDADSIGTLVAVTNTVQKKKANLGIGGVYITNEAIAKTDVSGSHAQDCAAFITQTSTALPRYRAIMGPFHWSVWLAVIFIYMFAIIPLAFSHKHTLRHLIERPQEIENMFWYVFGTFTNLFTFSGRKSWSHSSKSSTRLLVGFYWMFSIIITACYTGSIIAFVTLPVFPATVDTADQLISGRYQIGTLDKGGWQSWFAHTEDYKDKKLLEDLEYVPTVEEGLRNTTKAFFWPYAFLGSRDQLDYIVRTNFTTSNKRSVLHISTSCFVPFHVAILYIKNSVYKTTIDDGILRVVQAGLLKKMKGDMEWQIMRSATGKLLAANSITPTMNYNVEDRALTLADTQGMFLLLGAGFLLAAASLLSEWLGGCVRICKRKLPNSDSSSMSSNHRTFTIPTPREKLDSVQYSRKPSSAFAENSLQEYGAPDSLENANHFERVETNCIVHHENLDAVIDQLYDFGDVFGEKNVHQDEENVDVQK